MIALLSLDRMRVDIERVVRAPDLSRDHALVDKKLREFDEQTVKVDEFLFSHMFRGDASDVPHALFRRYGTSIHHVLRYSVVFTN